MNADFRDIAICGNAGAVKEPFFKRKPRERTRPDGLGLGVFTEKPSGLVPTEVRK